MKHRIVFYTDTQGFGGAEQSLLHLMAGLERGAWDPWLACHPRADIEPLLDGARARDVPLLPLPPLFDGWKSTWRFASQLREMRPHVFHAHLTWPLACKHGLLAAVLARVPAVVTTVHLFVELPYPLRARLLHRLVGLGVHRHIAVSRALGRRLQERFKIPGQAIRAVPNGIPLASFAGAEESPLRSTLAGPTSRPIVLNVGRLVGQKGQLHLLEAAALIPAAQFVFAGDGPDRDVLQAKALELGLDERVTFLGQRADIADLLSACDVFVLPSLFEGLPLSILEAMAAAKPVVATSVGGNPEVIADGETGLLVPPADPAALAAALRRVLSDAALAARLAAAGHAEVQRGYSVDAMVRGVTAVYAELLRQP